MQKNETASNICCGLCVWCVMVSVLCCVVCVVYCVYCVVVCGMCCMCCGVYYIVCGVYYIVCVVYVLYCVHCICMLCVLWCVSRGVCGLISSSAEKEIISILFPVVSLAFFKVSVFTCALSPGKPSLSSNR